MRYDNVGYSAAIKTAMLEQGRLRIGDVAASFGVSEIEVSAVMRGQEPSQKFTEAAAMKFGVSYAAFAIQEPKNDIDAAIDIMAQDNVLPFPYRYRVQDDV